MGKQRLRRYILAVVVATAVAGVPAFATVPSSQHYQLPESQFGSSPLNDSCSGQYCATSSIGDTIVGETGNSKNTANFGSLTDDQPSLEVIVSSGNSNRGVFSTDHATTQTMTVRVRSYLSNGYTLQVIGDPPKYGGHMISALSTPTSSTPGTEQFGINVVANSSPNVGANPTHLDAILSGYNTPNKFKYASGDTVAKAVKSSGQDNYTISMIVNISNATPAGHYSSDFSAVVTPVY